MAYQALDDYKTKKEKEAVQSVHDEDVRFADIRKDAQAIVDSNKRAEVIEEKIGERMNAYQLYANLMGNVDSVVKTLPGDPKANQEKLFEQANRLILNDSTISEALHPLFKDVYMMSDPGFYQDGFFSKEAKKPTLKQINSMMNITHEKLFYQDQLTSYLYGEKDKVDEHTLKEFDSDPSIKKLQEMKKNGEISNESAVNGAIQIYNWRAKMMMFQVMGVTPRFMDADGNLTDDTLKLGTVENEILQGLKKK